MGQLVGEINPEWAAWVADLYQSSKVWQFNDYNAEAIQGDVPLARLGGLAVTFGNNIVSDRDDYEEFTKFGVVNLALDEPGIITTTPELLGAAREKYLEDAEVVKALKKRCKPSLDLGHNGFEHWIFPLRSLTLGYLPSDKED